MKTLDAIRAINHLMGGQTRQALLEPRKAGLRIFDLFAEGSVQLAHSIAFGKPSPASEVPDEFPIVSRMSLIEDRGPISKSKANKKFSKRL
jgi:hypothetical protein